MFASPRTSLAVAVVVLAVNQVVLSSTGIPAVGLDNVARFEGQTVRVEGAVQEVEPAGGGVRFLLVAARHGLEVHADDVVDVGSVVRVEGRLARLGLDLVLFADRVETTSPGGVPRVPLSLVAADADARRMVRVEGRVHEGALHGDGVAVALGTGSWPPSGGVRAIVLPVFEADCACVRLHASGGVAWTD